MMGTRSFLYIRMPFLSILNRVLPSSQSHQLIAMELGREMNKHANQKIKLVLIKTVQCVALSVAWLPDAISWGMLGFRVSDISDASAKAFSHILFGDDLQIYMLENGSYDRVSDGISLRSTS